MSGRLLSGSLSTFLAIAPSHAFEKRAVSPEKAADAILTGIEKNKILVYTSNDIRFGYWWARKFAPPYEYVMQKANDRFSRFLPPA